MWEEKQRNDSLLTVRRRFMLFRESNRLCLCLSFLLLIPIFCRAAGDSKCQIGTLAGGTAFVDDSGRTWLGDAANVTVELEYKSHIVLLVSDDLGDYIEELGTGTYYLKSARSADGKPLRFARGQHKSFKIGRNKTTRFDVMLLKPVGSV
jgi:hypothetical protein